MLFFRGLVKVLPRKKRSITVAAFVSALLSVPAAAVAFTLIYALGGTTDVPITKVATAMIGVHVLIGIGEATITALTVGAVVAVRPDLVYGARGLQQRLKLRVGGDLVDAPAPAAVPVAARTSRRKVWRSASSPPSSSRASSASTPPRAPTAWRRSPRTRASTRTPRSTTPRTPRSPGRA